MSRATCLASVWDEFKNKGSFLIVPCEIRNISFARESRVSSFCLLQSKLPPTVRLANDRRSMLLASIMIRAHLKLLQTSWMRHNKTQHRRSTGIIMAQRIFYVLCCLTTQDDDKFNYDTQDIVEAYNDTYCHRTHATTKTHELKHDVLVREVDATETTERRTKAWKLQHPERARSLFLNKNFTQKRRMSEVIPFAASKKRKQGPQYKTKFRHHLSQWLMCRLCIILV
jgi:hypothetical protein